MHFSNKLSEVPNNNIFFYERAIAYLTFNSGRERHPVHLQCTADRSLYPTLHSVISVTPNIDTKVAYMYITWASPLSITKQVNDVTSYIHLHHFAW